MTTICSCSVNPQDRNVKSSSNTPQTFNGADLRKYGKFILF